jgi:hypothetical protein
MFDFIIHNFIDSSQQPCEKRRGYYFHFTIKEKRLRGEVQGKMVHG